MKVLIISADNFEDTELLMPLYRLQSKKRIFHLLPLCDPPARILFQL